MLSLQYMPRYWARPWNIQTWKGRQAVGKQTLSENGGKHHYVKDKGAVTESNEETYLGPICRDNI